jgi:hypothetical protein
MFEKIRQAINSLTTVPTTPATPTTPDAVVASVTPAAILDTTPKTDTLDAAVASLSTGTGRADLVTIKVNGLDQAKQNAVWLTKGQDRTQPATAVRLVDCTSDHLKNIVLHKPDLSSDYLRIIESILEDRGESLPDTGADDAYVL